MAEAVNNYRYERKFFISGLAWEKVKLLVKSHPAMFREIYYPRYVNNIYFDTFDMKSYFDNVYGASDRVKVRIRWYGDLFGHIEKPVLEFKIKKGLLGTKKTCLLKPFCLDEHFDSQLWAEVLEKSDIPHILRMRLLLLRPALLNRYNRCYYLSADRDYRITVDNDMEFCSINGSRNSYLHKYKDHNNVVLELKYDHSNGSLAHNITSHFSFRMTKSSKYLNGIECLAF
ncbi:MAG: VTC domain-containing protein [Sedimentisphaerales bacterium]|nr:VTC domain-containing protein [Sedimentisphaerales bacterium]